MGKPLTVRDCRNHLIVDDELLAELDPGQLVGKVWAVLPSSTRASLDRAFVLYDLASGRV